jgi:uncharacterized membrane protein HdeD (DUF308 family)
MSDSQLKQDSPAGAAPTRRAGPSKPPKTPRETPDEFRARSNLKILSEVYRNHWEVFLRGYALYMATCSALIGISAYKAENKPLGLFVGVVLVIASILSIVGTFTAYKFMQEMKEKVEDLCRIVSYHSFISRRPVDITALLTIISIFIMISGLCQIAFYLGWIDPSSYLN